MKNFQISKVKKSILKVKIYFLRKLKLKCFSIIFAGAVDSLDESTLSEEDSLNPNTPIIANDETNDSDSHSSAKR